MTGSTATMSVSKSQLVQIDPVQCGGYVRNTQKTTQNWMESVKYGWPVVAKFNNVYLYATIYIDSILTQDIFIQQLYWFNFNTGYFHSRTIFIQLPPGYFCGRQIFIQLQRPKLCFMKRIHFFSFNKKIVSFNKTHLLNSSSSQTSTSAISSSRSFWKKMAEVAIGHLH